MSKKITVPPKPQSFSPSQEAWLHRSENPDTANGVAEEPLVRLTFDIPESLHRRIKINCAQKGIKRMTTELRRILNQHFPA